MKVKIHDKEDNSLIAGEVDIPDEILKAALLVRNWLEKYPELELYGMGLKP